MDIRIGVTHSPREIDLQLAEDTDLEKLQTEIADTLSSEGAVLWLTDRRGKVVGIPAGKVAYVELETDSRGRSIGFSS